MSRAAAFSQVELSNSFFLWCLSSETIRNILQLELVRLLGLRANPDEVELLLRVIERMNFTTFSADWKRRGD